jgi:hypothetical protein
MKRWLFILLLASHPALSIAQVLAVNYHDTITVPLPGALAAFSMNDFYAEANAESEMLTVYGRNPGSAHIVIVTVEGSRIFEVRILPAPPSYPPGFVHPLSAAAARENGSYESRFTSDPSQLENIVDFMRHEGDREVSFHLAGTIGFIPYADRSTFAFSSVFYQILTPDRDITLLDQLVNNSPLTVYDSIVRGFHLRQGKFFFHTGYTSATAFENLILPAQKQGLVGLGYRFSAGSHAYLMPNFYLFSGTQTLGNPVQRGAVASLVYHYAPRKNLGLLADAGFSRGIGAAGQFHLLGAHDQITADLRYQPTHFAALSLNNLHGFYSNFDWTRHLTSRFTSTFNFTGNHYKLPALDLTNLLANMGLQLQLSRHWSVFSGLIYSRFQSHLPLGPAIATTGLPMGVSFDSVHFQNSFMYEYSRGSGPVSRSDEFRATLGTHWSGFRWDGFVDRQTQAMSIAFTTAGTPALQDALNNLGVSATTPEQVALALGETAGLLNEKLIQGINLSVNPVRLQAGSYLSWSNRARSRQRFDFRLLYNDNELQHGENRTTTGTFAYSLKFKDVNEIVSSVSLFHNGGHSGQSAPIFAISIRRQIGSAPNFIISRRRGTISGIAFADTERPAPTVREAQCCPMSKCSSTMPAGSKPTKLGATCSPTCPMVRIRSKRCTIRRIPSSLPPRRECNPTSMRRSTSESAPLLPVYSGRFAAIQDSAWPEFMSPFRKTGNNRAPVPMPRASFVRKDSPAASMTSRSIPIPCPRAILWQDQ